MLSDPAMVDTNVLVYALYEDSVHYETGKRRRPNLPSRIDHRCLILPVHS